MSRLLRDLFRGLSFSLVLWCAVASCSQWTNEDEVFTQTYTEVIIAREQFSDSNQANKRVGEVLKQNGFTELSFRQRFQELAGKPERLRKILDSARNRARRIGEQEQKREQKQLPNQEQKKEPRQNK